MTIAPRSAVILIVEDDPNDALFLRRALRKADVRQALRVARDGQEAIDYLSGTGQFLDRERFPLPCLVVLDVKLPKKNGLEVLKWLRHRDQLNDLPVVMVSSSNENGDKDKAMREGIEAYRVKPVSFDKLIELAREIQAEAEDHCKDAKPCPKEEGPGH
jgi:CheY-like chemotaxis protein